MSIISKKFSAKIDALKSEFKVNKDVAHQGVKGGLNEGELSSLISEVIPSRYKVTKGIVENSKGEQSNETDIFIYDDEILPPYIKNELTFVPVEAVKYYFEVKSKLNASELKTTIAKFEHFRRISGVSPTVLFAFSSDITGSELARYQKNDARFFDNPVATVLCVSDKCYYYKETTEHYIKDHLSVGDFIKQFNAASGLDMDGPINAFSELMKNDDALNGMSRSQFALSIKAFIQMSDITKGLDDKNLTVNGIVYNEVKFKVHKWVGVECSNNGVEMSFLSGISNTLSKGNFGSYLLDGMSLDVKIFSICYEDMWGNLSCQDFDEGGLNYNPGVVSFTFEISGESGKINFEVKR